MLTLNSNAYDAKKDIINSLTTNRELSSSSPTIAGLPIIGWQGEELIARYINA